MSFNVLHILDRVLLPNRCYVCERDAHDKLCRVCRALCRMVFSNQSCIKSIFHYQDTIRTLILGAKVEHKLHFAHLLTSLFKEALPRSVFYRELIDFNASAIVAVPTRRFVLYQRGFDVTTLLAGALSRMINVPVVPLLRHTKGYNEKVSRIRHKIERFHAIQGSFSLECFGPFERLILIDDIVTSGATLNEAKKTLSPLKAKIMSLTVAKTPFIVPNLS